MCGIFGAISNEKINENKLRFLAMHSRQRGFDSSGLVYNNENAYKITRADDDIKLEFYTVVNNKNGGFSYKIDLEKQVDNATSIFWFL